MEVYCYCIFFIFTLLLNKVFCCSFENKNYTDLFSAYGINSILYQRGLYPPESFTRVQKYNLTLLVTGDEELTNYLNSVVNQVRGTSFIMISVLAVKFTDLRETQTHLCFSVSLFHECNCHVPW